MLHRRFSFPGLFAVLLALMAQLGADVGVGMPRVDPVAGAAVLCHSNDAGDTPIDAPNHPVDCQVCPLCVGTHVQVMALASVPSALIPPSQHTVVRTSMPPPSTAPPSLYRPPSQPRAPPSFS